MAKHGEVWSDGELQACVEAYAAALKAGGAKKAIAKDVYVFRALKKMPGRNEGAVLRRMGNISHIVVEAGKEPVIGWKPLANVGPRNAPKIQAMLIEAGALQGRG